MIPPDGPARATAEAQRAYCVFMQERAPMDATFVQEAGSLIRDVGEATNAILNHSETVIPETGSVAHAEFNSTETGSKGEWGERVFRTAHVLGHMACHMQVEMLMSHAALVQQPLRCWPFEVLARTSIEAAAVVKWLFDPECTPRGRVIRSILLRWASADENDRLIQTWPPDEDYRPGDTKNSLKELCSDLGVEKPKRVRRSPRPLQAEDQVLPGYSQLASSLLESDGSLGASYRLYCQVTHAQAHGFWRGFTPEQTWNGEIIANVSADEQAVWMAIALCCRLLFQSAYAVATLYGTRDDRFDNGIDRFDARVTQMQNRWIES